MQKWQRREHVSEKMHCPEHCLPGTFFIFLEGFIIAIKCYPENPTTIHFLSLTEKEKKKKRTKGFFEI